MSWSLFSKPWITSALLFPETFTFPETFGPHWLLLYGLKNSSHIFLSVPQQKENHMLHWNMPTSMQCSRSWKTICEPSNMSEFIYSFMQQDSEVHFRWTLYYPMRASEKRFEWKWSDATDCRSCDDHVMTIWQMQYVQMSSTHIHTKEYTL